MILLMLALCVFVVGTTDSASVPDADVALVSPKKTADRKVNILQEQYNALVLDIGVLLSRYEQLEDRVSYQEEHGNSYIAVSGGYTDWSLCEVTCGGGTQTRYKICGEDNSKTKDCKETSEYRPCNTQKCPTSVGGAMYVIYGRSSCPNNGTEEIHSGYVGGSHSTHKGGGVNMLCLPLDPVFGPVNTKLPISHVSYIYGAEYQMLGTDVSKTLFGDAKLSNHDVPCAVCRSRERSSVFVFSAMNKCYDGWHSEYHGYLVSGYYNVYGQKTIECMDSKAEQLHGGLTSKGGALLYPVVTQTGALPSPPYYDGHVVPCSVCTK